LQWTRTRLRYLSKLFPQKHETIIRSQYNTRNKHQIYIPRSRLELFKKSFVPDSKNLWNSLALDIWEAISINAFRKNILPQITIPPSYFSFGKRYANIIHTKLRHNCILLCDLDKRNITNSPYCACGHIEDAYHFFFLVKIIVELEIIYSIDFLVLTWSILTQICFYLVIMLYLYTN
jgi:hypothetical protein